MDLVRNPVALSLYLQQQRSNCRACGDPGTITMPDIPPVIIDPGPQSYAENSSQTLAMLLAQGTDTVECPVVWEIIDGPAWIVVDEDTGELTIEPPFGSRTCGDPVNVRVGASNCAGEAIVDIAITVTAVSGVTTGMWDTLPSLVDLADDPLIALLEGGHGEFDSTAGTFTAQANRLGNFQFNNPDDVARYYFITYPKSFGIGAFKVSDVNIALNPSENQPYTTIEDGCGIEHYVFVFSTTNTGDFTTGGGNPVVIS